MKIDLKNSSTLFWLLVAILVITFIPFLGEQLYATKGEPREAIVAVSMLQQDNWICPKVAVATFPTNRRSLLGASLRCQCCLAAKSLNFFHDFRRH